MVEHQTETSWPRLGDVIIDVKDVQKSFREKCFLAAWNSACSKPVLWE